MKDRPCPFCDKIENGVPFARNHYAAAILDGFPISEGHLLVVPIRHEADFFNLNKMEQAAVMSLLRQSRATIKILLRAQGKEIDGFNVGINIGEAAGQTVGHAHVHLIPRFKGDVQDPRGGVRWIIPGKAKYWKD